MVSAPSTTNTDSLNIQFFTFHFQLLCQLTETKSCLENPKWREKPRRRCPCPCGSDQWERLLTCEWNGSPPGIDSQRQCLGPFAAAPACSERSTGPGERVVLIQCTAGTLSRTGRERGGGARWGVHSQLGVCSASGSSSCLLRSSAPAGWNAAGCSGWLRCNGQCFHGWICCKAHKSAWSAGPSCGYYLPQLLDQMKTQNRVWKSKLLAAKTCWLCYFDIHVRRCFNGNLLSSVTMSGARDSIQILV